MMRMQAKVDWIGKNLEFVKRRLDDVDTKSKNVNMRMKNLEGNVETVNDYLKELREMMMNIELLGGYQGKALMEQLPLQAQSL